MDSLEKNAYTVTIMKKFSYLNKLIIRSKIKKLIAIFVVIAVVLTTAYYFLSVEIKPPLVATLSDLLNSKSERKIGNLPVIVSADNPYFTLIATPVALYYEATERRASPLLIVDKEENSRAVIRFLQQYAPSTVVVIGEQLPVANNQLTLSSNEREWEAPTTVSLNVDCSFRGSLKAISLSIATHFWKNSDGVILIKNDQDGYNQAVVALPLASYVNIPVIITDKVDSAVEKTLKKLGVKYSLVCGQLPDGYKRTKRFDSIKEIHEWTIAVVRERLGGEVRYITMTNPLDAYKPKVLESKTVLRVADEIIHSDAKIPHPGVPTAGGLEGQPAWYFEVPYKYANIKIDVIMDVSGEEYGDDSGARIIVFLGMDNNGNGYLDEVVGEENGTEISEIMYFCSSVAYSIIGLEAQPYGYVGLHPIPSEDKRPSAKFVHLKTELPVFNAVGEYCIQLQARLPTDNDRNLIINPVGKTTFTLTVTVEELDSYIYPRLRSASSLAGYLTAYRTGVVLAKPEFMIWNDTYVKLNYSSNPSANLELIKSTNERVGEVKKALNDLLGMLADMPTETEHDIIALADHYHKLNENGTYTYIGILADTDMIPHFYYDSKGLGHDMFEGYKVPSDIIYSDIDADLATNPVYGLNQRYPRLELADGRITGFDVQDISALLSRTFFYSEIIDAMDVKDDHRAKGLGAVWKNNGLGMSADAGYPIDPAHPPGTEPAQRKAGEMWRMAGMTVDAESKDNQQSARQEAGLAYESSNFISILVHGFWYWYVPTPKDRKLDNPLDPLDRFTEIGAGSMFSVAHTKLMNFGPSTMWATSCVTGRLDGIPPYNAVSNAFLHAGMNCYVGATRSMWGSLFFTPDFYSGEVMGNLMMLHFFAHLCGYLYDKSKGGIVEVEPADTSVGVALMLAKNFFIMDQGTDNGGYNDDTYEAVLIHGDPAFNPYTPNFDG